jgi:hypothetical protein
MVWVVVGDRSRIEPSIRDLGLGEVRVIEEDDPSPEPVALRN